MRTAPLHERLSSEVGSNINEMNIVVFQISPKEGGCCCTDCWKGVWEYINTDLELNHTIPHEGSALATVNGNKILIESHESGPELVTWIEAGSAIVNLISAVIILLGIIIEKRRAEKPSTTLVIKRKKHKNGKQIEEILVEIPPTASSKIIKNIIDKCIKL